ncbi:MAG: class I SAM-dependent methyltransferase [Solirubrobacterales bacterium]|nr:class I SAM-dependent methyltransferase [Solirubrobacterales bacterium]
MTPETAPQNRPSPDRPCDCCGGALTLTRFSGPDRVLGVPGEFRIFVCEVCGTGTTEPFVAEEDLVTLYEGDYDNHTEAVAAPTGGGLRAKLNRAHQRRVLHELPLNRLGSGSGKLLDVGCGNGNVTKLLAGEGWNALGIEPSPDVCEVARKNGIEARPGTINTADLEDGSFDVVLFFHTLEHVAEPSHDLARAFELLAPGGQVVIASPNFGCWQKRLFGNRWIMLELPRHRTHLTTKGLGTVLERVGYEVEWVKTSTSMSTFPHSVYVAITGHGRVFETRAAALLFTPIALITLPFVAALNFVFGGGDVVDAMARKPS